jgi:hypothetical protein
MLASVLAFSACGGGGSSSGTLGSSSSSAAPASGASGASAPATASAPETASAPGAASAPSSASDPSGANPAPTLAAATAILDGTSLGTAQWAAGSTASGGTGQAVAGLSCAIAGSTYTYAHLSIYQNGQLLSLPAQIGTRDPTLTLQTGCSYPVHTDDTTGKIRMLANPTIPYTLGQFFAVWGQTLTNSNVAGLTASTITTYVNDGGTLTQYTGNLPDLELTPHREITIVLGTPLTQIPTYAWTDPPPFDPRQIVLVYGGVVGTRYWPDGITSTGGTGQPVDGIVCAANLAETYHVHAHVAIYKDGQMLAFPAQVGITSACDYETHTHDNTGIIHMETPNLKTFTLGKFFDLWGEPLTTTNVAGAVGPLVVYINDNGDVRRYMGDPRDIVLTSLRDITLQVGTAIPTLPTYNWYELQ